MKSLFCKILTVCALVGLMALNAWADNLSDLPVTKVGGRDCYYYEVQPKETVYSLCRRFGVSREELLKYNPVGKKETAYCISKKFGLTTDEFYALNPEALDGLKAGQTVRLTKGTEASEGSYAAAGTPARQHSGEGTHEIASHETLYQIARDNNTTVAALLAANPGLDERDYKAGQVIRLSEGACS